MNLENRKANKRHRVVLSLKDKIDLEWPPKHILLSNLKKYYTCRNIKKHKNHQYLISTPIWDKKTGIT